MKFKLKLNKRNINPKRRQEILFMFAAVALILFVVPLASALIYRYDLVVPEGEWTKIGEEDVFGIWAGLEYASILYEQTGLLYTENATGPHYVVLDHYGAQIYALHIVLDLRIDTLSTKGVRQWNITIYGPTEYHVYIELHPLFPGNTTIDWMGTETEGTWCMIYDTIGSSASDNETLELDMDSLDMVYWGVLSKNGILTISIVNEDYWGVGDSVGWDAYYLMPPDDIPTTHKIWRWGAGIMGGILCLIALASTPFWNPAQPGNPGPIDRTLSKTKGYVQRKNSDRAQKAQAKRRRGRR